MSYDGRVRTAIFLILALGIASCKQEGPAIPVWEPVDGTFTGCEGG